MNTTFETAQCDHIAVAGVGWTRCEHCGSSCERDGFGKIVVFQRGTLDLPRFERSDLPSEGALDVAPDAPLDVSTVVETTVAEPTVE